MMDKDFIQLVDPYLVQDLKYMVTLDDCLIYCRCFYYLVQDLKCMVFSLIGLHFKIKPI